MLYTRERSLKNNKKTDTVEGNGRKGHTVLSRIAKVSFFETVRREQRPKQVKLAEQIYGGRTFQMEKLEQNLQVGTNLTWWRNINNSHGAGTVRNGQLGGEKIRVQRMQGS